jgi:hypothetical protein
MQYRVCEKNPNSKIYNKLLFVCGDENIKSESYKLSHIFSTNCIFEDKYPARPHGINYMYA